MSPTSPQPILSPYSPRWTAEQEEKSDALLGTRECETEVPKALTLDTEFLYSYYYKTCTTCGGEYAKDEECDHWGTELEIA